MHVYFACNVTLNVLAGSGIFLMPTVQEAQNGHLNVPHAEVE
jgi:hypothetical protein